MVFSFTRKKSPFTRGPRNAALNNKNNLQNNPVFPANAVEKRKQLAALTTRKTEIEAMLTEPKANGVNLAQHLRQQAEMRRELMNLTAEIKAIQENVKGGRRSRTRRQKGGGAFNRIKSLFTRKGKVAPAPAPAAQNKTIAGAVAGTRPITQTNEFALNYQMATLTKNSNLNLTREIEPLMFETFRQIIPDSDDPQQYFYLRVLPKSAKVSLKKFPTNPFLTGINSRPNMIVLKSYIVDYLTKYYKPIMDNFGNFGPMTAENFGNILNGWKNNLISSLHALKRSIPGKVDAHVRNVVDKNAPRLANILYNNSTAWKNEGENISIVTHTFPIIQEEYELGFIQLTINLEFVIIENDIENILPPISWIGQLSASALQKLINTFPQVPEDEFLLGSEKQEIVTAIRKGSVAPLEEEGKAEGGEAERVVPSRATTVASNPANSYSRASTTASDPANSYSRASTTASDPANSYSRASTVASNPANFYSRASTMSNVAAAGTGIFD